MEFIKDIINFLCDPQILIIAGRDSAVRVAEVAEKFYTNKAASDRVRRHVRSSSV